MITESKFVLNSGPQSRDMVGDLLWGMSPSIPMKQKWIIDDELEKSPYTLEYLRENIVTSYSSGCQNMSKNMEFVAKSGASIIHYPRLSESFDIARLFGRSALNNIDNHWSSWMSPGEEFQIGALSMIPIYKTKTIDLALFTRSIHNQDIRIDIFSFYVDTTINTNAATGGGEGASILFLEARHFKPDLPSKSSSHSLGHLIKPISYISSALGLKKYNISREASHRAASTWLLTYLATSGFRTLATPE